MSKKSKIILAVSILIGGFLSVFASSFPDGLEKVAEDKGFVDKGYGLISGIIPDYVMPGISYEPFAVALAGIVGTLVTFYLIVFLGKVIVKFKKI